MEGYIRYYSIVNKDYMSSNGLNSLDKLLLIHITALCYKEGYCYATNRFFAEIYGYDRKTISRAISKLVDKKIIDSRLEYNNMNLSKRYLSLHIPVWTNVKKGLGTKCKTNIYENDQHNIKYENKKEKEINKIISYDKDGVMLWNGVRCESEPCSEEELKELEELLKPFRDGDSNE